MTRAPSQIVVGVLLLLVLTLPYTTLRDVQGHNLREYEVTERSRTSRVDYGPFCSHLGFARIYMERSPRRTSLAVDILGVPATAHIGNTRK